MTEQSGYDPTGEDLLRHHAHAVIRAKLFEWLMLVSDALDELQPPRIPYDEEAKGALGLAFGLNLANNAYPHIRPHLATTTANIVTSGLTRLLLPVAIISETQRYLAQQNAAAVQKLDANIRRNFEDMMHNIYNKASDRVDEFYVSQEDIYIPLRETLIEQVKTRIEDPFEDLGLVQNLMNKIIDNSGLIETKKEAISERIDNAFNPLARKVELIAMNSPANFVPFGGKRRILVDPRGEPFPRETPGGEETTTRQSYEVRTQQEARYLMKNAYKLDVQSVQYTDASYDRPHDPLTTVYETRVTNTMPNRTPSDLVPDISNEEIDIEAAIAASI